jgi:predicted DNA-binding transcriptional regulator AlpA
MSSHKRLLPRRLVRERYNVSNMTLWRWEQDPRLNFPKPLMINGRLYQDDSSLDAWDEERAAQTASVRAALA